MVEDEVYDDYLECLYDASNIVDEYNKSVETKQMITHQGQAIYGIATMLFQTRRMNVAQPEQPGQMFG